MEKLLAILEDMKPGVDFKKEKKHEFVQSRSQTHGQLGQ